MQSIEIEEKPVFYSEDENGYIDFLDFDNILNDEDNWIDSTCGTNNQNIMNRQIRISKYYKYRHYIMLSNEIKNILDTLSLKTLGLGKFLKYERGGVFKRHKDSQSDDIDGSKHTHYLLIYFPGNYKGGDLIVYDNNGNESNRVITHEGTKYKYIILKLGTYHESTKIIYGTKILYKIALYSK